MEVIVFFLEKIMYSFEFEEFELGIFGVGLRKFIVGEKKIM